MHARRIAVAASCGVLGLALVAAAPTPAPTVAPAPEPAVTPDPDRWADVDEATIHPAITMVTEGASCTANFVFEEWIKLPDGTVIRHVYLGYAAHCAGLGSNTDTNGCETGSRPLDTPVDVQGASRQGRLAYSSWHTMVAREEDPASNLCRFNDFALVRLHPADHGRVNPSLPHFGGPAALGGATATGDRAYSVGNSSLRYGIEELKPKYEASLGMQGGGWIHRLYAVTPGIPGDSGSGHVDDDGRAIGVSSTLQVAPYAGSNGVTDLRRALDYLRSTTPMRPQLAKGTEPFDPSLP